MLTELSQALSVLMRHLPMWKSTAYTITPSQYGATPTNTRYVQRENVNVADKTYQAKSSQAVLNLYGEWLFERRDFREAAFGMVITHSCATKNFTFFSVFRQANKPERALIAHEKALDWQELFELVSQQELPTSDIAYRVAGTY